MWLGGFEQLIAMGYSFAALQSPFLALRNLSSPVACSSLATIDCQCPSQALHLTLPIYKMESPSSMEMV